MASQFSLNSTYDEKLAQNVSSVVLNGIGSLLKVSSGDARMETKDKSRRAFVSGSLIFFQFRLLGIIESPMRHMEECMMDLMLMLIIHTDS